MLIIRLVHLGRPVPRLAGAMRACGEVVLRWRMVHDWIIQDHLVTLTMLWIASLVAQMISVSMRRYSTVPSIQWHRPAVTTPMLAPVWMGTTTSHMTRRTMTITMSMRMTITIDTEMTIIMYTFTELLVCRKQGVYKK